MAVNAIGGAVGSGLGPIDRSGLSESDFIHLFLTQLTFQDPLNPVDNREFLAQLAQFTNIQQTQVLSDNISGLLQLEAANQAVGLIGKTVEVSQNGQSVTGSVTTVTFQNGQPLLTVNQSNGQDLPNISPASVVLVR